MNRFFKNLFGTKTQTSRKTGFRPTCEMLEARRLAAGDIRFANGLLTIYGGDFMDVAKVEVSGNLVVAKLWSALNTNVVLNPNSLPPESDSITVNFEIRSELASAITQVKFTGKAGNDHFRNLTTEQGYAHGGPGNDSLQGGSYFDELVGGPDDDTYLFAGAQIGTVIVNDASYPSGGGIDTLDFRGMFRAIKIDLANTDQQVVAPEIPDGTYDNSMAIWLSGSQTVTTSSGASQTVYYGSQIENVKGSNYADVILGNSYANRLEGRHDNDRLEGREGNDTLVGGTGNDTYSFASLAVGDDTITELASGGTDWLDYSGFGSSIGLDLSVASQSVNGFHGVDLDLTNPEEVENVIGTSHRDWIWGNGKANRLEGRGDADTLEGRGGNDSLIGGSGSDTYWFSGSNLGHDRIEDDAGVNNLNFSMFTPPSSSFIEHTAQLDGLHFTLGRFAVSLDMGTTSRQTVATDHLDLTLSSGTAIDDVTGSSAQDYIFGNSLNNTMFGGDGNDWLEGAAGSDWLHGGSGADILIGCDGLDHLFGEDDDDQLWGGFFDDVFADDSSQDQLEGGDGWDSYNDNSPTWWN